MTHLAQAYPSLGNMWKLGVFLLSPGRDACLPQGLPQALSCQYPFMGREGQHEITLPVQGNNTITGPGLKPQP